MSYQVTLNSRNVLVPLSLEDRSGERMNASLSRLDTATAMVIQVSAGGAFTQEFIPLRICHDAMRGYAGNEWELWVQKAGDKLCVYYLGVPDRLFAGDGEGKHARSLSVQVVGSSPLTGREDFSGGLDITLQAEMAPPLIPGFLSLGERFFPTLLPHNFIASHALEAFEFGGKRQAVLMVGLQTDPADRVPVSMGKHWEPKNWIQAVVENLAPAPGAPGGAGYYVIKGGCFYGRNRKITHWFGSGMGLEEKGFREAATEKIRAMGQSGNGAWVFWLEPQGKAAGVDQLLGDSPAIARQRISVRHPMLHHLLSSRAAPARPGASIADLPAAEVVAALSRVAGTIIVHQDVLQSALAEPSHADWSERSKSSATGLLAAGPRSGQPPSQAGEGHNGLEADIRELYRSHGETLRSLESVFDETYGYSAWDSIGNPMREVLSGYLDAQDADARTRA